MGGSALIPPYSCCHCHFVSTKAFCISKRPVPKANTVSGVNSNFILVYSHGTGLQDMDRGAVYTLMNKHDYQKQRIKKKEEERKRIFGVKKLLQSHS